MNVAATPAGWAAQRTVRLGIIASLLGVVAGLDMLARSGLGHSLVLLAALDEPAHLATAALLLVAVAGWAWCLDHPRAAAVVLVSSVAIDLDHVPMYVGLGRRGDGRPVTHSLATVLLLVALWCAVAVVRPALRRHFAVLLGLAAGVCLHLVRDLATGPGVRLWWPLSSSELRIPYVGYAVLLVVAAGVAVWREWSPAPAG